MKNSKNIAIGMVMVFLSCVSLSLLAITPAEKEKMMRALETQKGSLLAIAQNITFTLNATDMNNLKEFIVRDIEGLKNNLKILAEGQRILIENQQKIVENM